MQPQSILVRAANPDEGRAIAGLWRELWDAHEAWGGYAGTRDTRVYEQLAQRLSEDARVRGGQPILGRHIHLVASTEAGAVGQDYRVVGCDRGKGLGRLRRQLWTDEIRPRL